MAHQEFWSLFLDGVVLFCRISLNDMEYQEQDLHQVFSNKPIDMAYLGVSFIQKWKVLMNAL
jgi:hypothetical protein